MLKRKPLIITAALAATVGITALSSQAHAGDPLLGAVLGAGIGAAIGHGVQGRDGAVVGGAIGAIAGASIAASSSSYYDTGYYGAPPAVAPAQPYYGSVPVYFQPAPVVYPRGWINYGPRVGYAQYYGPHYVDHGRSYDLAHPGWHGNDGHFGH
jgi:hypothetical protein